MATVFDPYQTEAYARFVDEMAKHCRCSRGVCDGVLAGGPCDEIMGEQREFDDNNRDEDEDYDGKP